MKLTAQPSPLSWIALVGRLSGTTARAQEKPARAPSRPRGPPDYPRAHSAAIGRSAASSSKPPKQWSRLKMAAPPSPWSTLTATWFHWTPWTAPRGFWVKFAIGKAVGAVTLQQTTAESGDQIKTNPQRFHSALSLMEGQVILIPGGFPLIVDNVIVGAVGSAGHRGDGDVRAVKAGMAAWEKLRQSKKSESMR